MLLANATAADMTALLELLGTVFTFLISKISDVVTVVMENPLLLVPIGVILAITIISMFYRMFGN